MTTIEMLQQLGVDWEIELTSDGDGSWTLILGRARMRKEPARPFVYRDTLTNAVSRAYAGSPPDDVGELES